jgi:hypothetical protein
MAVTAQASEGETTAEATRMVERVEVLEAKMTQCLERSSPTMEILELREVDCDWQGALLGYFAIGYLDSVAFVDAINAEYEPSESFVAREVRHEFWVKRLLEPDEPDCDCTYFEKCWQNTEGAIAVTCVEY